MSFSPFFFARQSIDFLYQSAKQVIRRWTKPFNHDLALNAAMDLTRSKPDLILETMLLRQQLIVLKRQVKRPQLTRRDRTFFVLLSSRPRLCYAGTGICSVGCGGASRGHKDAANQC